MHLGAGIAGAALLAGATAQAAPAPHPVALPAVVVDEACSEQATVAIGDLVLGALRGTGRFQPRSPPELARRLGPERNRRLLACPDDACRVESCREAGLGLVATAELRCADGPRVLSVRLVDARDPALSAGAARWVATDAGLSQAAAEIARVIAQTLREPAPEVAPPEVRARAVSAPAASPPRPNGNLSRYQRSERDAALFPGLVPGGRFSAFAGWGSGATAGLGDLPGDAWAGGVEAGAGASTGAWRFALTSRANHPGDHEAFVDQVAANASAGNSAGFASLRVLEPARHYALQAGWAWPPGGVLGLRVAYGAGSESYTPADGETDAAGRPREPDHGSIGRWEAALGWSGDAGSLQLDAALSLRHVGVTYLKDTVHSGFAAFVGGGGLAYGADLRIRFAPSKTFELVPQAGWRRARFELVEDSTVPPLGAASGAASVPLEPREERYHTLEAHTLDAGLAGLLHVAPFADVWLAAGTSARFTTGSVDMFQQDPGPAFWAETERWEAALPYLRLAADFLPLPALRLSVGAEKSFWRFESSRMVDTFRPAGTPFEFTSDGGTVATRPDMAAWLGANYQFGDFTLEAGLQGVLAGGSKPRAAGRIALGWRLP